MRGEGEGGVGRAVLLVQIGAGARHSWFPHCPVLPSPLAGTLKALEKCVENEPCLPTSLLSDTPTSFLAQSRALDKHLGYFQLSSVREHGDGQFYAQGFLLTMTSFLGRKS